MASSLPMVLQLGESWAGPGSGPLATLCCLLKSVPLKGLYCDGWMWDGRALIPTGAFWAGMLAWASEALWKSYCGPELAL